MYVLDLDACDHKQSVFQELRFMDCDGHASI